MSDPTKAESLKTEGNALFVQKRYKDATAKYDAAIALDPENAILWSNRAACYLNLRKYSDALSDAKKATELDPSFAKAWSRVATAEQHLGSHAKAIEAWEKALSSIPSEGRTEAQEKQAKEYEDALGRARKAKEAADAYLQGLGEGSKVDNLQGGKMPWERADKMREELVAKGQEGMFSSAWLILGAYEAWQEGVEIMNNLKKETENGQVKMTGSTGAIQQLSNAIMRDKRVFHIADPEFLTKFNDQVRYEAFARKAWVEGSPDSILKQAQDRLAKSNWDDVRPALSMTVRGYILRAFMTDGLMDDSAAAVAFYNDAIDILTRGRQTWADVADETRGIIFTPTFIRGVKSLRLEAYMTAYTKRSKGFNLEKLKELADELEKDIQDNPPDPEQEIGPGFLLAFYNQPLAQALAMQALYHREMAGKSKEAAEAMPHLARAGELYAEAASHLPADDETHTWFLNSALGVLWQGGAPLRITLPLMEKLRESVPQMKRIWEHSQLALGGRDKILEQTLVFEREVRRQVDEGRVGLDEIVVPQEGRRR